MEIVKKEPQETQAPQAHEQKELTPKEKIKDQQFKADQDRRWKKYIADTFDLVSQYNESTTGDEHKDKKLYDHFNSKFHLRCALMMRNEKYFSPDLSLFEQILDETKANISGIKSIKVILMEQGAMLKKIAEMTNALSKDHPATFEELSEYLQEVHTVLYPKTEAPVVNEPPAAH